MVYGNIMSLMDEEGFATATTLTQSCYESMFNGCTKLGSVTCLATDIDASCLTNWLSGAGTEASEPKLYVLSSMLNATWNNGSFTVTAIPSN